MEKKVVIIIGAGHLALRLKLLLLNKNDYAVIHTTLEAIQERGGSIYLLENIEQFMKEITIPSTAMVYLIDEKDEHNLQMTIALISKYPQLPITVALFNENLIPHVQAKHSNLLILNPAKIAAPVFVDVLYEQNNSQSATTDAKGIKRMRSASAFSLVQKLLLCFIALLLAAVCYFHFFEKFTWINSFYFVVITAASVGYGDINLLNASNFSKVFDIILILSSTIFIWMIFSLTIDSFFKKRVQLALGRKKYSLSNHIVVCGLGRLGYFIVEELIKRNEKVIIIEQNENARHIEYFRHLGAEIYIGDGKLLKVLSDVNIAKASALISVISSDFENVEVGLNARTQQPNLKLILRIFDEQMADKIKEHLNIHHTLSASAIADGKFYEVLKSKIS